MQYQRCNNHILRANQRRLPVRAKRPPHAHIISERDKIGGSLEEVGREGQALGGLGGEQFEELRNFDDGGDEEDPDAEGFGEGEAEAGGVGEVKVEDEGAVALGAEEGG